jgi:hypothetical protein
LSRAPGLGSPSRQAALEVILLMADADARWGDYASAVSLLDTAAAVGEGRLPEDYALKRVRWARLRDMRARLAA